MTARRPGILVLDSYPGDGDGTLAAVETASDSLYEWLVEQGEIPG